MLGSFSPFKTRSPETKIQWQPKLRSWRLCSWEEIYREVHLRLVVHHWDNSSVFVHIITRADTCHWAASASGRANQWQRLCVCSVAQACPTLCNPMDCSLPGSSVHGIFQTRILEWVAISFSRGSSRAKVISSISCVGRWILYYWATSVTKLRRKPNSDLKALSS